MVPWRGEPLRGCLLLVVLCAVLPMVRLVRVMTAAPWQLKMTPTRSTTPWVWALPCLSCSRARRRRAWLLALNSRALLPIR
jgi:hypothetical protein